MVHMARREKIAGALIHGHVTGEGEINNKNKKNYVDPHGLLNNDFGSLQAEVKMACLTTWPYNCVDMEIATQKHYDDVVAGPTKLISFFTPTTPSAPLKQLLTCTSSSGIVTRAHRV